MSNASESIDRRRPQRSVNQNYQNESATVSRYSECHERLQGGGEEEEGLTRIMMTDKSETNNRNRLEYLRIDERESLQMTST